ncbi:hypothetical protein BDV95DRAFT_581072 [Massariosphaeria phaeospora]|uniref:Uncharacterized protein n=1 Tax=Massariosphaeria phaeospora TaxID=100035 RepID=A0A7C8I9U4_9PLEO|nr:hypothetical protein BDV95DRAFT_581072 [Massariosphaeria phaeospora]
MTGVYEHVSCVIQNEEVSSAADFIGIQDIALLINPTADQIRAGTKALTDRLTEVNIPTWYSVYASPVRNEAMESTTSMIINGTLPDTSILYNSSYRFLSPYNALSGGTRFEWTNVRYTDQLIYQYPTPRVETYGITRLESDGSIQLTEQFDALSAIFANYNTKSWLSGPTVDGLGGSDRRECKPENIVNRTSSVQATVTLTVASEWVLPTRPPGLDAIITSGMQGTRGQMVDVLVTTVKHQIRDSKGEIMTDVVLSPSKSESRSTTARGTAGGTAPPSPSPVSGLTTGAKAGIGAGVGVAGAITLLAVALFLLQRRKSKAAAVKEKDMARASDASVNGYKAELATGPDVEAQPPVELPDKGVATPAEVTGTEYPGIGTKPIELPVHEPALEMPDPKTPK